MPASTQSLLSELAARAADDPFNSVATLIFLLAVIHAVGLPNINANVYMFSTFCISILAGVICYLVLERPVLHVGRQLVKRLQPMR